jgi:integrase
MTTRTGRKRFPLWFHKGTGLWCKKHKGHPHYFGPDKDAAEKRYLREWPDILAGRVPRQDVNALVFGDLMNEFLTAKRAKVDSGELTRRSWDDYHRTADRIVAEFGRGRAVVDLRPTDFGKLRATVAKKLGPAALARFITLTRTIFAFAFKAELIAAPVRYGDQFDKPPKRVMRLERHVKGARIIQAADFWKLVRHAGPQVKAMLWLGMNAAYTQKDCADLQRSALLQRPGWLQEPRNKSGIARRCPLWPETLAALADVERIRPEPRDPADADCVFLTKQGRRWVRYHDQGEDDDGKERRGLNLDAVALEFRKLAKRAGVTVRGGPGILRKTFRTISDEVKDQPAAMLVMGHADHSISSYYRELVGDDRLKAVTDHVRAWLLKGKRLRCPKLSRRTLADRIEAYLADGGAKAK